MRPLLASLALTVAALCAGELLPAAPAPRAAAAEPAHAPSHRPAPRGPLAPSGLLAAPMLLAGNFGDRFIYWPTKYPVGDWRTERAGLTVEDRALVSRDGTKIAGWWSRREGAAATVLFLHGNGGNLSNAIGAIAKLQKTLGANVYAVDYRGYGKSAGRPSEEGLYMDAEAAYEDAVRLGADPARLFLHGHSLGTGVATELASRRRVAGVTLEAPFTSITAMVKRAVPFADPKKLVSERYDTLSKIAALGVPVLVIHGTKDATIPVEMGRAVFAAAREPKALLEIEGAGHNDCRAKDPEAFYGAIRRHMEAVLGAPPAAPEVTAPGRPASPGGPAAPVTPAPTSGRRVEF